MLANATTLVIIGTYSAAVHLFGVNPQSGITSLGISTAFGTNQEALLFVADPLCSGEGNLLAVKNNCACDEFKNGRSGPTCCTARGALVSARITEAGSITAGSKCPCSQHPLLQKPAQLLRLLSRPERRALAAMGAKKERLRRRSGACSMSPLSLHSTI